MKKEVSGSLTIDKGKYYAVINTYGEDGKRKQKWISTGIQAKAKKISEDSGKSAAYREAQAVLAEKLKEYGVIEHIEKGTTPTGILFADYLKGWIELYKRDINTRQITAEGYESYITKHLYPFWLARGTAIENVTPRLLQEYLETKIKKDDDFADPATGKIKKSDKLSPTSLQKHLAVMSLALQEAQKQGVIPHNPVRDVKAPKKVQKNDFGSLSMEQCQLLLNTVVDTYKDMYLPIFLGIYFGLRRSEVAGLRWQDVDTANAVIHVRFTRKRQSGAEIAEELTKTTSSKRDLHIGSTAMRYFEAFKALQEYEKTTCGKSYDTSHDYVCRNPLGKPTRLDYISRKFKKILIACDLPIIRFHDLRASYASQLFESGDFTPKEVAEQLGHSDIRTTLGIYGRVHNEAKIRAADQRESLFKHKE